MNSVKILLLLPLVGILGGCLYAETPHGRVAAVDLPMHNTTTINKTVHIVAPPGTTVVYEDSPYAYVREPYPQTYPVRLPIFGTNGNCLDASGAAASGLKMARCNGKTYQNFAFVHNTLQTGGQCVSANNSGFSSRSRVSLRACNGSIGQQWFADGRHIRSMLNGQCLDAQQPNGEVRLQECDNSLAQQFGRGY